MRCWRLSRYAALDGGGGLQASGRWHTRGKPVIYAGTSPAGALTEVLVHLDVQPDEMPDGYRLVGIDVPDQLWDRAKTVSAADVDFADERACRKAGDVWLATGASVLCRVPSAVIGHTVNVLINPRHSDMGDVSVAIDEPFSFDPRLFKPGS
ncbi:MAG: RES family NAD+ phosphorylase [Xanthomonadaceae bacterium]|nr:RES family NAD+ phosphorylase [Xanthomonadaceae bacterium]MDE1959361.1 RES family NAD+ phosphorylase [Xanthomonadaceae bacterium]MDE2179004.1 RES family NAD+ phosphorylase [Xanthomonadaceae bacterium]MDE2245889.1 RES family NAD+ phosphorylase [Xanthomonadaceae bacterium]